MPEVSPPWTTIARALSELETIDAELSDTFKQGVPQTAVGASLAHSSAGDTSSGSCLKATSNSPTGRVPCSSSPIFRLSDEEKLAIEKHGKRLFRATRRRRGICGLSRNTAAQGGCYFKIQVWQPEMLSQSPLKIDFPACGCAPRCSRDLEIAGLFNGSDQCRTEQDAVSRAIVGRSSQTMVDCTCPTPHAMPFGSRPGIGLTADGAA